MPSMLDAIFNRGQHELEKAAEAAEDRVADLKRQLAAATARRDKAADRMKAIDSRCAELSAEASAGLVALQRDLAAADGGGKAVTSRNLLERWEAVERARLAAAGLANFTLHDAREAVYRAQEEMSDIGIKLDYARTQASGLQADGVTYNPKAAELARINAERARQGVEPIGPG